MNPVVEISNIHDGNMLIREDELNLRVNENRASFLAKHGIDMKQTTRVNINYHGDNYLRYYEVSEDHRGNGMYYDDIIAADALVTRHMNHALFLPVADCVGAAIFDIEKNVLMLSHLGRHSLEQNGAFESIQFLIKHYGSDPAKLKIWLTPAPGSDVYPMYRFHNRSIKSVVFEQFSKAGVDVDRIRDNTADTTKDRDYFSHSEFLKGNRPDGDGRYAIVAMMKSE